MKKTWMTLLLTVMVLVSLLPVAAFAAENEADPYAGYTTVSVSDQDSFNNAVSNPASKIRIQLGDGNYTMSIDLPSSSPAKEIVFTGNKAAKIFIPQIAYAHNMSFTFDGVTVQFPNSTDYVGLAHIGTLTYKNCKIEGKQTLYSPEVLFEDCTLENMNDYCIWTWVASNGDPNEITFTDCELNTGGKGILVYNGATTSSYETKVYLTNCTFTSNGTVTNKAAVETGSDGGNTETSNRYEITFTNCTISGFAENNSTSPFWGNKNSMDHEHLIVNLHGVEVTAPYVDMSGITLNDKVYDGQELTFTGAAKISTYRTEVKTSDGDAFPFTYTWYKKDDSGNYAPLSGSAAPKEVGEYKLVATLNTTESIFHLQSTSGSVFVTIRNATTIITQPQDQYVLEGEQATFTVAAQGDGLTYQWYINRKDGLGWQKIDGETSSRYTTSATKLSNDGFMYYCEVSDIHGKMLESDRATLHVSAVPNLPQTGDNSNIALWGVLLILSASYMFVILNKRRLDGTR